MPQLRSDTEDALVHLFTRQALTDAAGQQAYFWNLVQSADLPPN